MTKLLILTGFFLSSCLSIEANPNYPFELPFDDIESYNKQHLAVDNGPEGSAVAMWKVDVAKETITVAMATTQSFVALGLNPSTPSMAGSDIVACHYECSSVVARDYYASGHEMPKQDITNDWIISSSGHSAKGITWCVVTRTFLTCNIEEDYQIYDAEAVVSGIMAFGVDKNRAHLHYHKMNRKFTQFVFDEQILAEQPSLSPSSLMVHTITSPITVVPHDSTGAEICSYHILPPEMAGSKKHVVGLKFENSVKDALNAGLTHHTILYGCKNLIQGAVDGALIDCSTMWSQCGDDWLDPGMIMRSHEGIPVGKNYVVATVLLRHYYNPKLLPNIPDQNQWTISYTPELRPYEPMIINLQTTYINIPAKASQAVVSVYMPHECIDRVGNITIEAVRHHMHDYGVSARLRHIRGNQELAPIDVMASYKRGLSEGWIPANRQIRRGDMLIYECVYDNPRDTNIVWGERREDEMCVIALKTKGTDINNALSFSPGSPGRNEDPNNYKFNCRAPSYKNLHTPDISIDRTEFEDRIAGILPYEKPQCPSKGHDGKKYPMTASKKCPTGWYQPKTEEECQKANPGKILTNLDKWAEENPKSAPFPRCFSHTSSDTFGWISNGIDEVPFSSAALWCVPDNFETMDAGCELSRSSAGNLETTAVAIFAVMSYFMLH